MPDYSKTIIYKLCSNDLDITDIYIGSTCNFHRRKASHKNTCYNESKKSYNGKVYKYIRDNGGFENWNMIQLEEKSLENKREKEALEREWIEKLKPSLNSYIPTRTDKEYYQDNKEKIKERVKKHRELNKDKINEHNRKYHQDNREKILKQNKEKITCECGSIFRKNEIARHQRTKKHQSFILENN